ncbi:MAG: hypothetical protein JWO15_3966 [Sphingomonadales bacterium]|jgi:hypothetical protein|nr:hypothetical protein [Sphingomonadales bacterium]
MIAIGRRSTSDETRRARPYPTGEISYKAEWMKTGEGRTFSPTVFLYEQPGDTTLSAHFHHNNQFQIFIEGAGKIGPRTVGPVVVHYAGAYTGYGPLKASSEGLKYFTLRTVHEAGAIRVKDVQAGKSVWPEGPRRHATSKQIDILSAGTLAGLSAPDVTNLIPAAGDGLEVRAIALPPGCLLESLEAGMAAGIFLFVMAGSLDGEFGSLLTYESLYASADEAPSGLVAGEEGCHLLALAMPKRDPAFG